MPSPIDSVLPDLLSKKVADANLQFLLLLRDIAADHPALSLLLTGIHKDSLDVILDMSFTDIREMARTPHLLFVPRPGAIRSTDSHEAPGIGRVEHKLLAMLAMPLKRK